MVMIADLRTVAAMAPPDTPEAIELALEPIARLSRDLRAKAKTFSPEQARYMVNSYYTIQGYRMATGNQRLALEKAGEPHAVIDWYFGQMEVLENQLRRALDAWTDASPLGRWAKSIPGIGPVIAAGLLAHIDIRRSPTVGHIWRFAGLDPTSEWLGTEKAEALLKLVLGDRREVTPEHVVECARWTNRKPEQLLKLALTEAGQITRDSLKKALARRPWNADLKVLMWKVGESFVKVSGRPNDIYGKVYLARKAYEQAKNEAGDYAEQAAKLLQERRIGKETEAYKYYSQGKLPPGHIHSRSKRYAGKLFLAHYHHVAHELEFGCPPPRPYILDHSNGTHVHFIAPPLWPPAEAA